MGMMESASREGIGQTTIGVGVEFGAELASTVAAVRGGNLFFFPDLESMEKTFTEELDTLVTELAYDLDVTIRPSPGLRLTGVYGIPGEKLKWDPATERFTNSDAGNALLSRARRKGYELPDIG